MSGPGNLILCKGFKKKKPIIIKTEVMQLSANLYASRGLTATFNKPDFIRITMPRIDALRGAE